MRESTASHERPARNFELICEIEPPTRPDLTHARHQIGVLSPVTDAFLIPDNHIGRATVSSIAVAHEVQTMGGRSIACVNSRDRNLLGFRRDLLTAAAYGVEEFLFVHGDKPTAGNRTSDLTVRAMMDEARAASEDPVFADMPAFRVGAAAGVRPLPAWKRAADFLFVQVSYSVDALLRWRDAHPVELPVYAGVMVLASAGMARRLAATIPDIDIPDDLVQAVERDRTAGVEAACDQVLQLRDSGAFAGVHLVPVSRYRQVATRLEDLLCPPPDLRRDRPWRSLLRDASSTPAGAGLTPILTVT
ncbi:methylenetetrahydrofolate reductase [Parafrankia soli]|uniref:methylenetetrahydrofolate reductase n=1 Tax=Parafrankia soli TaxID=2599596 RepID=UPI000AA7AA20|nr:methylenetetrahydrofolate reductase [Parafrankia soli]